MSSAIRKVAVLGSGVMGSGIAAHVANAGLPVLMLDVVPAKSGPGEDPASPSFRNKLALG
ncbi:MAG TPA: 3-hydroxyacyl-CoA dehydrogenase NAD-binding domain-containing protein, partial [Myxococcaceae bacterium]|nr:3-hydroxyacyl-CoA dehydrogenase NAD-binding domain-containing protein [Myxococcaceae bacterium]